MADSQSLRELVVKADEASLNKAIAEHSLTPDNIITVIVQPAKRLATGDCEAKYRVIYRA